MIGLTSSGLTQTRLLGSAVVGGLVLMLSMACGDDEGSVDNSTSSNGGNGGNGTTTTTTQQGGNGGAVTTGGMGGGAGPPTMYPAGPYGKQVGEIFPYLEWEGYVSTDPAALATTETWTDTYTSLDLYMSPGGYALVHTSLST